MDHSFVLEPQFFQENTDPEILYTFLEGYPTSVRVWAPALVQIGGWVNVIDKLGNSEP